MRASKKGSVLNQLLLDIQKLRAPEGYLYAGHPNYHALFGRDSLIAALQTLPIYPEIARDSLRVLAKYQAQEASNEGDAELGKILHEYRFEEDKQKQIPDWSWPYYGSVDSTSWFLILLEKYTRRTGDMQLMQDIWPSPAMAVKWHLNNSAAHPDGFITYERKNPHGLFHQGWKDSPENHLRIDPPVAIVEEQGYAYLAMGSYLLLQEKTGITLPHAREARELASLLKKNFVERFWMEDEKCFALALDAENRQRKAVTSNPGHLLMCGDFLEKSYAKAVAQRLFERDIWTIGGIRTYSEKEPDFDPLGYHLGSVWPHDNWIIYEGLLDWGLTKEAGQIKQALLKAYSVLERIPECYAVTRGSFGRQKISAIQKMDQLERNAQTMGENHLPSFSANPLQAWSTGALLNMLLDE